ncbi:hypothetical protein T552_01661 [Pneumocystis carinii B80]|uniref:non-specific serine/threonine protein kinase n=1 Tax=Pneumocystis carinii (strain B80) TaxID=1408658 RepID=A0A0W4ZJ55_PNEC8|nr:hypothetical protein T552_01661 [Pneumocystis carinii B80]KTW28399.1 hypothetical protein T552_01661 [Pneumocystis carinii B80]
MNELDINKNKKAPLKTYGKSRYFGDTFEKFKVWNDIGKSPDLKKKYNKCTNIHEKEKDNTSFFSRIRPSQEYFGSLVKDASFLYKISVKQNYDKSPLIKSKEPFQCQENIMLDTFSSNGREDLENEESIIESLQENIDLNKDFMKKKVKESPIIESLLSFTTQKEVYEFSSYISSLLPKYSISKLGEASYSEVYLMKTENCDETVLKIIPFGKDGQLSSQEVLHEVRVTTKISSINGFVKSKGFVIVKGMYPEHLLFLWDKYDEVYESENSRPDSYDKDQYFCILLLEKGGKDLEHVNITTWRQVNRIFWDIVKVLAQGEKLYEFEHRDLHWGNILVDDISDSSEDMLSQLSLNSTCFSQPCIIIIDYTLSRLRCDDNIGELTWNNFEDHEIFEAHGDYQYEIYRLMKDYVSSSKKVWSDFIPRTNVFWLHYLIDKLIHCKGLVRPPARMSKRKNSIQHAHTEIERMFYERAELIWKMINPKKKGSEKKSIEFNSSEDVLSWGLREGLI